MVMDEKRNKRSHTRKYLGVILQIGKFSYYAPFSSPKTLDYNKNGSIKKDSIFCLHMVKTKVDGSKELLGTIKLTKMIPVPLQYVSHYSFLNEKDVDYAALIFDEFKWINRNKLKIIKNARVLYNFKKNEQSMINDENKKIYDSILPFCEIEKYLTEVKLINI